MIFQAFRRYEFSCSIKPIAMILHVASTQKMTRKNGSVISNVTASVVRSLSGKCCSDAITRQLAMIVTRIVYSNGGHSIMNRISLRSGWSSANRNNDVGPDGLGAIIGGISSFTFWRGAAAGADGEYFGTVYCGFAACGSGPAKLKQKKKHPRFWIFTLDFRINSFSSHFRWNQFHLHKTNGIPIGNEKRTRYKRQHFNPR